MKAMSEATRLLMVICIVFLAVGMSQGAIGPALQDLARQSGSSTVVASWMLTAVFVAALTAQTVAAVFLRLVGHRPIMFSGMVCFLLGISAITLAGSLPLLLGAAALKGLGDGALVLVGNVVAAEASKSAGPLNLVNAMYGVGAILSPALVGIAIMQLGSGIPGLWAVPCVMTVPFALLIFWRPTQSVPAAQVETITDSSRASSRGAILRTWPVWLVAGFAMTEVSLEISIATWLPTLLYQVADLPLAIGSMALSWFWLLMTVARFVAAWASRRVSPLRMLVIAASLSVTGCMLLVVATLTGSSLVGVLAVSLLGPALGPILPTSLSILRSAYPRHAGAATGLAFGSCNIAGALMPPLFGALIVQFGAVAGSVALMFVAAMMISFLTAIAVQTRRGGPCGQMMTIADPVVQQR
jgi:fucose permease